MDVLTGWSMLARDWDYCKPKMDHSNMLVIDQSNNNKERHIPFIEPDFVTKVCFETKQITVDWDPSH